MRLLPLLLLAACTGSSKDTGDTGSSDTGDTADTSAFDTADTSVQGTDADHDGWTVEAGDCDDRDPWVNPGLAERNDGIDNDCDGMVDETFDAVMVVQVDTSGAIASRARAVDLLGDLADDWDLAGTAAADTWAQWMAVDTDGGWWLVDSHALAVFHVSETGAASVLWSVSGSSGLDPAPMALYGAAPSAAGVLTSTGDRLVQIGSDGTATVLASWDPPATDGTGDLQASAVAADPRGQVTLLGQSGGVATWSAEAGYALVVRDDPQHPMATFSDATADEQGRVFALGNALVDGTFTTGVFRWDATSSAFVLFAPWEDSSGQPIDFTPAAFAMDSEQDQFYVTANGGWFRTVWRLLPDAGYGSVLWPSPTTLQQTPPPEDEHRFYTGAAIRWAHD